MIAVPSTKTSEWLAAFWALIQAEATLIVVVGEAEGEAAAVAGYPASPKKRLRRRKIRSSTALEA